MHVVLEPLGYHQQVARRLMQCEPASWAAFADMLGPASERIGAYPSASTPAPVPDLLHEPATGSDPAAADDETADEAAELYRVLARTAYRLDEATHPQVHAAARRAAAALDIGVPIAVHQLEGSTGANATLRHLPGEVVITLSGNLLDLLTDDELCAVFGHELAHRLLWTAEGGRYLVADRLLDALSVDPRTPAAFLETARRWALATELYADRGALRACGDLSIAVSALAKVATGLSVVDAAGYLAQATAAAPEAGSLNGSHPETVLRAWALERWGFEESDRAAHLLLRPELDVDRLDLPDQHQLEARTRHLIDAAITDPALRGDDTLALARKYFPDLEPAAATPTAATPVTTAATTSGTEVLAGSTRRYLAYVLLDLATVDPDAGEPGLLAALRLAGAQGVAAELGEAIDREGLAGRRAPAALLETAAALPSTAGPSAAGPSAAQAGAAR